MGFAEQAGSPAGPLAGLRVIDVTSSYSGPTAAMYMGDLGADVIKVERLAGDDTRGWGPPFVDGESAWFASANRNKRSIALDIKEPRGSEVLRRLIASADVFLENFNPSKLPRLGLSPERVMAANPRLVYCSFSGFGMTGPAAARPGYDLIAQAASGLMSVTGPRGGSPQRVSTALADVTTAICAVSGVCAALVQRGVTGRGDVVDVSLIDSAIALMAPRIASYLAGEPEPRPSGGTDSVLAIYQSFPTADRDIVIAIGNDAMWERFCRATELDDLLIEAHRDNNGRRRNRDALVQAITARLGERPAREWLDILADASIPTSLVNGLSEVVESDQLIARGSLLDVPLTDGALKTVASPFRFGSQPWVQNERPPGLGEHTAAILAELGFTEEVIADLIRTGVVKRADAEVAPEPRAV